jgi:hypothetical protein
MNEQMSRARVNQHQPAHHPPDACYDSVVDEPSTELINIWFHLCNPLCTEVGSIYR